jgi:hypothetical protein
MKRSVFWTKRRLAGMFFLVGVLLFASGTATSIFLVDARGTSIFLLPPQQGLRVIAAHSLLWQWMNILQLSGTAVTIIGLVLLSDVLRDAGDRTGSQLGLIAFLCSAMLWILILTFRLSVSLWAAQATTKAVLPGFYEPLYWWADVLLFTISIILAFCALAAYAAGLLVTAALPRWAGWITLAYAVAGLGLVVFAGAALVPPELAYLVFAFLGVLLLLPRSGSTPGSRQRETALAAHPSEVVASHSKEA